MFIGLSEGMAEYRFLALSSAIVAFTASTPNACDSEDNDYDPDGSKMDEKVEGDESSSNESDFYSASEDNGDSPKNKQKLELPYSNDSEDDDYDPDAPDLSDQVKQESSSFDFTSDSEDFSVAFNGNISPCKGESVPDELMSTPSD